MVELKTAEHIIHFMKSGNIRLSRFDGRFIDNLAILKEVTTNQVELFNKLIYKYRRQFAKHEIFVEKLVTLPWTLKVIESAPEHTNGYIYLEGNKIMFRCPFNRNFINKFRNMPSNHYVWNREKKLYEAVAGPYNLKVLFGATKDFFPKLSYCNEISELLEPLEEFKSVKYWTPTLVKANGRLYISALNEYLNDALSTLELNTEPATLATLALHGVDVDIDELHNDPKLLFAAEFNPVIEKTQIAQIIPWLKELGCEIVLVHGSMSNAYPSNMTDMFKRHDIKTQDINIFRTLPREIYKSHKFPVAIRTRSTDSRDYDGIISKSIRIVNSEPISIK